MHLDESDPVPDRLAPGNRIAETSVMRRVAHPDLHRVEPDHNPGVLFEPPGEGPHPGVLVLHGSGGKPLTELAKLFASHGYAAFALHDFDTSSSQVPDLLQRVPLSIVEEGAVWLRDRDRVRNGDIEVIGWSRGGELTLLAGTILNDLGAVISVVPSGLVFEGIVG